MSGTHENGRQIARVDYAPLSARPGVQSYAGTGGGSFAGEIREYVDIMRRRAGLIRLVFAGVVILTLAFTLFQSPVYRATALVEIRGQGGEIPSIEALFGGREPTEEYMRTHFGLLQSTTLARRVIQDLGLDSLEEFNPEGTAETEVIVEGFLKRLVIDPVEESRLVKVSFEAGSADLAARIVNAVVDTHAELRGEFQGDAASRLATQVEQVESHLQGSEAELRAYAEAHDLPYLVEQDLTAQIGSRLGSLREGLTSAESERFESESRYDIVVREGRTEIAEDEAVKELEVELTALRREHARLSATFTDDFPATAELSRQIEHLRGLIAEERDRVSRRVESDYRMALGRERRFEEAIDAEERMASELGPQSGEYHVLRQAVIANRSLYATLNEKRREAEIAAAVGSTDFALIDRAAPPTEPHRPVFAMNVGLGLMLGLILSVGIAFMREMMDDTVQTVEDLQSTDDVPILAMIPAIQSQDPLIASSGRSGGFPPGDARNGFRQPHEGTTVHDRRLIRDGSDHANPASNMLADAFGALRASVLLKNDGPAPRSILVSSCRAGEGKTTVSVNFALSLAELGNRVLIVDADLRRPAIHSALDIQSSPGLRDCLMGDAKWTDVVKFSVAPGLDVLTSGGATSRAGELIASNRLAPLLRDVERHYDFVIVDAPALFINASDARFLSRVVDGVVVVVRSRSTPRSLVDRIPRAAPNLLGIVVNDLRRTNLPNYFGDYFADYGEGNGQNGAASKSQGVPSRTSDALQRLARWIHSED